MKIDVTRQPLLPALATLLLLAAFGMVRSAWMPFPTERIAEVAAPLGRYLTQFQLLAPGWSRLLTIAVTTVCGVQVGRLTVRYGLYALPTCLAIPFYGLVACGIYVACDTLVGAVVAWLFVLSLRNFCAAFRNGYTFNPTFRASFYLGLMPLVGVVALPLAGLVLPALFCFKRTLREAAVALFGLLLPAAVWCYLTWAAGHSLTEPLLELWGAFLTPSGFRIFDGVTPFTYALAGLLLFTLLCSVFFLFVDFNVMGVRQRAVFSYLLIALLACGTLLAAPCATGSVLPLAAAPVSVFMPLVFVRIHKTCSATLYAALFVLFFLSHLIA